MLQPTELQKVKHNLATEEQQQQPEKTTGWSQHLTPGSSWPVLATVPSFP